MPLTSLALQNRGIGAAVENLDMFRMFGLAFVLVLPSAGAVQAQTAPIIVKGACDPKSSVSVNEEDKSDFACDSAVIARTSRGTVLIQFVGDAADGRILGFAGTIEGRQGFGADPVQAMAVERLYLKAGGAPLTTSKGTCFLNWAAGKLTSVTCGAAAAVADNKIKAIAAFTVR